MPDCNITNLTDNNVLLRLSSGRTVQLGPRESTLEDAADVRFDADPGEGRPASGNPRIARLLERRLISIDPVAPPAKKSAAKKSAAKEPAASSSGSPK